jgi:hypothetical protein
MSSGGLVGLIVVASQVFRFRRINAHSLIVINIGFGLLWCRFWFEVMVLANDLSKPEMLESRIRLLTLTFPSFTTIEFLIGPLILAATILTVLLNIRLLGTN